MFIKAADATRSPSGPARGQDGGCGASGFAAHPAGIAAIPAPSAARPRARRPRHLRDAVRGSFRGAGEALRGEAGRACAVPGGARAAVRAFGALFSRKGDGFSLESSCGLFGALLFT